MAVVGVELRADVPRRDAKEDHEDARENGRAEEDGRLEDGGTCDVDAIVYWNYDLMGYSRVSKLRVVLWRHDTVLELRSDSCWSSIPELQEFQ